MTFNISLYQQFKRPQNRGKNAKLIRDIGESEIFVEGRHYASYFTQKLINNEIYFSKLSYLLIIFFCGTIPSVLRRKYAKFSLLQDKYFLNLLPYITFR